MTRTSGNPRAPLDAWQADLLRLTVFLAPDGLVDPSVWWHGLTGAQPESRMDKPRSGERVDSGPVASGALTLHVQPGRVDWLLTDPPEPVEQPEPEPPSFPARSVSFVDLMTRWLVQCPRAKRVAFGAVLSLPATDRATAYSILSNYLNFDLEPNVTSDFAYQINRERRSTVHPGLRINRFMKWSASLLILHALSVTQEGKVVGSPPASRNYFCRLELDINTSPEYQGELQHGLLPALFGELSGFAREIILEGDIQ